MNHDKSPIILIGFMGTGKYLVNMVNNISGI